MSEFVALLHKAGELSQSALPGHTDQEGAAADPKQPGAIAWTGVLNPKSFRNILSDWYQREAGVDRGVIEGLKAAYRARASWITEIHLGMRGDRSMLRDGNLYLYDPVYVIDGLQRLTALIELMEGDDHHPPFMGLQRVIVHFNTTDVWEEQLFRTLNLTQTKVSPNVLLSNRGDPASTDKPLPAAWVMRSLTMDHPEHPMYHRVRWHSKRRRGDQEFLAATTYYNAAAKLLSRLGSTSGKPIYLPDAFQVIYDNIGEERFTQIVSEFWVILDRAWDFSRIAEEGTQDTAVFKDAFLRAFAEILRDYPVFWDSSGCLVMPDPVLKRLVANFNPWHRHVVERAGGGTGSHDWICQKLVEAMNKGIGSTSKYRLKVSYAIG